MKLFCYLSMHQAAPEPTWNAGFYFTRCMRCRRELVRRPQQAWRAVPRGYRVVWKTRAPGYPDWRRLQQAPARPGDSPAPRLSVADALLARAEGTAHGAEAR